MIEVDDAPPTVSVVVVNYNGMHFLPAFFESLQCAFQRHRFEVVVVDNASTDGSAEWLRRRDDIRLVLMSINTGFTGGNNVGARAAQGDVLLLINNDTRVLEPLDDLVDEALRGDVGAAGCRLVYGDGRQQFSIGLEHTPPRIVLSWLGLERHPRAHSVFRKFETDVLAYQRHHRSVDWVSGACLATRRSVWEALGGLDADLFMYCEDVDYCRRARNAGWRISYVARPVVVHYEGGGRAWPGANALLRTARAYFIVVAKTDGLVRARVLSASLAAVFGLRAMAFRLGALFRGRGPSASIRHEKAAGFSRAMLGMMSAAWTGKTPPLP
jgi:hypothetical protein